MLDHYPKYPLTYPGPETLSPLCPQRPRHYPSYWLGLGSTLNLSPTHQCLGTAPTIPPPGHSPDHSSACSSLGIIPISPRCSPGATHPGHGIVPTACQCLGFISVIAQLLPIPLHPPTSRVTEREGGTNWVISDTERERGPELELPRRYRELGLQRQGYLRDEHTAGTQKWGDL